VDFKDGGKEMKRILAVLTVLTLAVFFGRSALAEERIDSDRFKIGPGDVLEISVWKDESLQRQIVVPPDRVISYPIIGDIDVTDMSVTRLREVVTERLSEYIPDATVTVLLNQITSLRVYLIGKANSPGVFPIDMETTVLQVLAMAGGLNPFAAGDEIVILRQEDGKTIKIPFNYEEVAEGKNIEQNIILKRGDVIVVP